MQRGGGAAGEAVSLLDRREQGGKRNWDAILEPCKHKLMNDNSSLIEGTEAIFPPPTLDAANGVFRGSHGDGREQALEASRPEPESDHRLHTLPMARATIWMNLLGEYL